HTIPGEFELYQNYPNPFNSNTIINYDLLQSTHVEIKIFDILGKEIITLVNNIEFPGKKSISWNGVDKDGTHVSSGVYIYNLILDDAIFTKKMLLIK
ncbi:MAG: T9SS type A sorting domain-containing protein, partial [Candidatus Neomarinimicrobiota bacterium]